MLAAYEVAHQGVASTGLDALLADWASVDLADDSVIVRGPTGALVALCDVVPSRRELLMTYAYVMPGEVEADAVTAYLAWAAEERARALAQGGRVVVRNYLPAEDEALAARLAERGYRQVRTIYRLAIDLAAPPPAPAWPVGVSVRAYAGAADEPAAYEAFELGSTGMWGRPGNTFEQWSAHVGAQQPGAMRLAVAAGQIVGASIVWVAPGGEGSGVVESLRVVPDWRRRGLGAALLADALAAGYAAGMRRMSLTVDASSTTGAPELYARAGMRMTQSYLVLEREL